MNKLNEIAAISSPTDFESNDKTEGIKLGNEESNETSPRIENEVDGTEKKRNEKDIIKFTMLFNKYNCALNVKKRSDEEKRENKYAMFFNKDVTIRPKPEISSTVAKILETKNSGFLNPRRNKLVRATRTKSNFYPQNSLSQEPQLSEPGFMFCASLFSSLPDVRDSSVQLKSENVKKFLNKRNRGATDSLVQLNVHPTAQDLRNHNSLTNLSKPNRTVLKGVLKSKIPSLTALDGCDDPKGDERRFCCDLWEDLMLMQSDVEKRLNLQISRSSNDNDRRSVLKFKKEDSASVSDSKLLYADSESKKYLKKCDKKSRGDSSRKERSCGSRKQVQWKTEVDVIYFSTNMAANGDRTTEVIGRVMEPLREEWEQQRKGFYSKMVSSHMESHMKDHFISLLKI